MRRMIIAFAALMMLLGVSFGAHAATITTTLGNDTPGFNDGDTPPLVPDILNAQSGQPAPFDVGIGHELFGPDFSASWTFNYGALLDPIQSADITIGILDTILWHRVVRLLSLQSMDTIKRQPWMGCLKAAAEGMACTTYTRSA